ncbi:hypothetical protein PC121_g9293 [Phytophthora cactorum]|nr:hypothetical protein PC120_g5187 [Phytophthora cactorum]KAG3071282.1 hypothetical protein PC121_g9293 [Phytophthora cactorum]
MQVRRPELQMEPGQQGRSHLTISPAAALLSLVQEDGPPESRRESLSLGADPDDPVLTAEHAKFLGTAHGSPASHDDEHLRPMSTVEEKTLIAYTRGEIELRHPTGFIKTTLPVMQRAILEDFHRTHVEYALAADVPDGVKLGKRLEEIFKANTGAN